MSSKPPQVHVTVEAERDDLGVWHVDVYLDGEEVGGGTSPHGFLTLADNILYGDTSDWLNDDYGALGNLERVS